LNRNEGLLLNSKSDDFGITFLNDTLAIFLQIEKVEKVKMIFIILNSLIKISLLMELVLLTENANDPAKGVKVYLLIQMARLLTPQKQMIKVILYLKI
jgi:hypothetical protein